MFRQGSDLASSLMRVIETDLVKIMIILGLELRSGFYRPNAYKSFLGGNQRLQQEYLPIVI